MSEEFRNYLPLQVSEDFIGTEFIVKLSARELGPVFRLEGVNISGNPGLSAPQIIVEVPQKYHPQTESNQQQSKMQSSYKLTLVCRVDTSAMAGREIGFCCLDHSTESANVLPSSDVVLSKEVVSLIEESLEPEDSGRLTLSSGPESQLESIQARTYKWFRGDQDSHKVDHKLL